MNFLHLILLSLLQGLTEFLPISSSAHLVLLPLITQWEDQGLALDVAAHLGTLIAVLIYFREDVKRIIVQGIKSVPWQDNNIDARLFWLLGFATIPVSVVGFLGHDLISEYFRSPLLIAIATIVFGLLLWSADVKGRQEQDISTLHMKDAIWIGFSQVLALIPGTSRSGITMTAGLMLGLNRKAAVRFSLLLSIPVILLSGGYETFSLIRGGDPVEMVSVVTVLILSWLTAWLTISLFLRFVEKTGMLPYVMYRLCLGGILLYYFL